MICDDMKASKKTSERTWLRQLELLLLRRVEPRREVVKDVIVPFPLSLRHDSTLLQEIVLDVL